jgi:hypothetical protein
MWSSNSTTTYSFRFGGFGANGSWSTAAAPGTGIQYAVRGTAMAAGCSSLASYAIEPDVDKNARHSYIYSFRGGAVASLDMLDIAGGANGVWSNAIVYGGTAATVIFTTGTCAKLDAATNEGRYGYLSYNGAQRSLRFDVKNRVLEPWCTNFYGVSTAYVGDRVAIATFIDPDDNTKLSFMFNLYSNTGLWFDCAITR